MQKQTTDVDWLVHWRAGGANPRTLSSSEMNQISSLAENPNLNHELLRLTTNPKSCHYG